jgi:vacuolar-type H+-ATPase subunit E/Vma4
MEKESLESAIRNETEQTIRAIAAKEAVEIKRLDDSYDAEVDDFKNRIQTQTEARISQESSKVKNRAGLDLKKLKLRSVEAFINRTVDEAVKVIRNNPLYKKLLLDTIGAAVARIPNGVEVRLMKEDLACEKEIRKALKAAEGNRNIVVVEDSTITWGGSIIVDVTGGRIFDNTIERIYFRKSPAIRREVMKLLDNPPGNAV